MDVYRQRLKLHLRNTPIMISSGAILRGMKTKDKSLRLSRNLLTITFNGKCLMKQKGIGAMVAMLIGAVKK